MAESERYEVKAGGSWKQLNPLAMLRYFTGMKGPSGFGASSTARDVVAGGKWEGKGKVAIVTGPYSGIGLAAARELAGRGCEVVLAGRTNAERGKDWVSREIGGEGKLVHQMELDLSSLESVKGFARDFKKTGKDLNILVNNAGIMALPEFRRSKDGHELQWATNHLGHFLLTHLLLDKMKETSRKKGAPQGRIVNVSSSAHYMSYKPKGILDEEELSDPSVYKPWSAYGQAKLSNVLHARELNCRLKEGAKGDDVIAVAVHPGVIVTKLQRHLKVPVLMQSVGKVAVTPFLKSIDQGAATTVYCATAPSIKGGGFYADCNEQGSAPESKRRDLGKKLWAISEKYAKAFY
ncbi:short-chain dehydrogenase/reductase [Chloropicon primus]|uniref:Short-chain dehydrogenase/reductase n=1 Tax=Chloropicon primus TaxID=1764295 RepID=A0A5B8MW42_9CHLO|nr:short-chain dehydrogenase/reductase [Chloropicon primus]UPR03087.1 short-chain dehydrogenase/reductase [Chloropicon primus]|mmetsp:Transcript_4853/g.14487  ORF Transcript_4853/g.14487 Transcript_4853/m.14487 type:complete len:350 (-) Transcript_4853:1798-2847(-)|eukprot:QDZ23874.1 short-chain dehydrogenase/reductase [Chloropicon primus]